MIQLLLGMPEYKREQLSVNCKTIEADSNRGQVNEQSKQDKSKINRSSKINLPLKAKVNKKTGYFCMAPNGKMTKDLHNTYGNVFFGHWVL